MKQRLLIMLCAVSLCSICFAQMEREFQVGKDGYEWYLTKRDGKQGAEDKNGRTIVPCEYSWVLYHDDSDKFFVVRSLIGDEGYSGIYTMSGRCLIPTSRYYSNVCWFQEDINYISYEKKDIGCGVCDRNGREVVFISGMDFVCPIYKKGKFYYAIKKGELWGVADGNGRIVIEPQFSEPVDVDIAVSAVSTTKNPLNVKELPYSNSSQQANLSSNNVNRPSEQNVPASRQTTPSAKQSSPSSNDPGLKYSGTFTVSPQALNERYGTYTEGFGPGFEIPNIKIYDDKIDVMGNVCPFKSTSGNWRIYEDRTSVFGETTYYYVDKNFNMKKVQHQPNQFDGSVDVFTYEMQKGSVIFSIIPTQNPQGGSQGGVSSGGRTGNTGSGHKCRLCGGSGRKKVEAWSGDKTSTKWCSECHKNVGMGHSHKSCDLCGGDGWVD